MTNNKILTIIREEINCQEGLLFEGMTYTPGVGYRNNQLLEIYDNNNKPLLTEGVMDDVQSVLDYAGFIPGIGDILDAINAMIYMMRKKWILGALSFIAVIPIAGSLIAMPFKAIHNFVGKKLAQLFSKMTTNGKAASSTLASWFKTGGKKMKGWINEIYAAVAKYSTRINSFLDTLIPKVNNAIKKYSLGFWKLPSSFVKSGNAVIRQLKEFFAGLAVGASYKSTKAMSKKKVKDELVKLSEKDRTQVNQYQQKFDVDDEKLLKLIAAWKKSDQEKYPTLSSYIAAIKIKETVPKINDAIKKQMHGILSKTEAKLWSSGSVVKYIQTALNIESDGHFGKGTETAVKKFQRKNGLIPDGVVGPNTWAKMIT